MNREEVIRIYDLANLHLEENEIDKLQEKYNTVLEFAKMILEVDTDGVLPMEFNPTHQAILRKDVPEPGLDREEALKNASGREYGYFTLKKVI